MKRIFVLLVVALAAVVVLAGLVHAVLVATQLAEPAATTVYGMTSRRLWATTSAMLALAGVLIGGLALATPGTRFGTAAIARWFPLGTRVALVAGFIATLNGALSLAVANGGPGTGNGVVGAAGALVLGLLAMGIGGLGMTRSRTVS